MFVIVFACRSGSRDASGARRRRRRDVSRGRIEGHTETKDAAHKPQVASVQSSVAQSRENVSSVSDVSSLALSQDRAASAASFLALAPA